MTGFFLGVGISGGLFTFVFSRQAKRFRELTAKFRRMTKECDELAAEFRQMRQESIR